VTGSILCLDSGMRWDSPECVAGRIASHGRHHMTKPLTVTIPQACKLTGLGRSTIYRLFENGKLQRLKAGSRTLIKVSDLEAYIESLTPIAE